MSTDAAESWQEAQDRIAARLRQIRVAAGLNGKGLADRNGWPQSKVSRLENGHYQPSHDDIRKWVEACGESQDVAADLVAVLDSVQAGHRDWKRRLRRGGSAAVQASYNDLVASSALVCHFEMSMVPGLLQTPAYAQHILSEGAGLADSRDSDIAAAVAIRMQRQQMLYDPARQFEFLLAEPVLRWRPVPADVMRGQLDRLQSVVGLSNIRLGILPFNVALKVMPQNSFVLYDDVALVETFVGEWTHRGDDAALYRRVLNSLWETAVDGEDARALIASAAVRLHEDSPA